ncbi:hypothetical protein [Bartonella sp. WD16.2]|uniref:hypothetical protein n=1 Tax=Bartonella sp. WD16.2 TaxID=1933904 RepID=UPI0009C39423|nr:hypothetical protein [Bartonella sp. WD16.2]AQX19998.1 hypothetical protein BWD162_008860 [Bartonella sp. WD16.2]
MIFTLFLLAQAVTSMVACVKVVLTISLPYSIIKYLKLRRKAIIGRDLAIQMLKEINEKQKKVMEE